MTEKNTKDIISAMKAKLMDIIHRYEQSGNGSNMNDSDTEEVIYEGHPKWGKFNSERAMRKNGDDRGSFLKYHGSDLLYWWHVLDSYDLICFTTAKLDEKHAAHCYTPPPTTSSRKKAKVARGDVDAENRNELATNIAKFSKDIHVGLSDLNKTMEAYASGKFKNEIESLKEKRFDLRMKLVEKKDDMTEEFKKLLEDHIKKISDSISDLESKM